MTVRLILEQKGRDVMTVAPDAAMSEVAEILSRRRIGALVVTDGAGAVRGIVSERDVVRLIVAQGAEGLQQPVSSAMTREVSVGTEEMGLDEAMEMMTEGRFRHLPICRDGVLVGIISIGDAVKRRLEEVQREAENMRAYIHTA